jgi:spore coat polysaccharide biosynthesis predicted glycosyltransferase SpsG
MRVLTLSEELTRRGHEVSLATNESGVHWLEQLVADSGVPVQRVVQHSLASELVTDFRPDWVVVDSYEIPADRVSEISQTWSTLAIVDGDARGIEATLYLDHNLGAETIDWPGEPSARMLAGSQFALVRDQILARRSREPWRLTNEIPQLCVVMGGSDPTNSTLIVARALAEISTSYKVTIVVQPRQFAELAELFEGLDGVRLISPTTELPQLFQQADIVISAAGTSAWELCTMRKPAYLLGVVENQRASLERLLDKDMVLGAMLDDLEPSKVVSHIRGSIEDLMQNEELRKELTLSSGQYFDGLGKVRVVDALERWRLAHA